MKTSTEIRKEEFKKKNKIKKTSDLKCEKEIEITALHHAFMLTRHKSQSQSKNANTFVLSRTTGQQNKDLLS